MSYNTFDILSGRGGKVNHHSGNRVFLRLVEYRKVLYKSLERDDKKLLIHSILRAVKIVGSRFLRKRNEGEWCELDDVEAIKKIRQAFREPDKPAKRPRPEDHGKHTPNDSPARTTHTAASTIESPEDEPFPSVEHNLMLPPQNGSNQWDSSIPSRVDVPDAPESASELFHDDIYDDFDPLLIFPFDDIEVSNIEMI